MVIFGDDVLIAIWCSRRRIIKYVYKYHRSPALTQNSGLNIIFLQLNFYLTNLVYPAGIVDLITIIVLGLYSITNLITVSTAEVSKNFFTIIICRCSLLFLEQYPLHILYCAAQVICIWMSNITSFRSSTYHFYLNSLFHYIYKI